MRTVLETRTQTKPKQREGKVLGRTFLVFDSPNRAVQAEAISWRPRQIGTVARLTIKNR